MGKPAVFLRLLHADDKDAALRAAVDAANAGEKVAEVFHVDPASFEQVPGSPFAYWVSDRVRRLFRELPPFENAECHVRCGMGTLDDFRFLRCWWEVPPGRIGRHAKWVFFAKGGVSSPYYSPIPLVVNYEADGKEVKEYVKNKVGSESRKIQAQRYYFRPGLTFGRRIRKFAPSVLPADCIFSDSSNAVFVGGNSKEDLTTLLGGLNGDLVGGLLSLYAPLRKMEVGFLQRSSREEAHSVYLCFPFPL